MATTETFQIIEILDRIEALITEIDGIDEVCRGKIGTGVRNNLTSVYMVIEDLLPQPTELEYSLPLQLVLYTKSDSDRPDNAMLKLISRLLDALRDQEETVRCSYQLVQAGIQYGLRGDIASPVCGVVIYNLSLSGDLRTETITE